MGSLLTEAERKELWLAERRKYITSTDVPILFGVGYSGSSPIRLYGEKLGIIPPEPASRRMRLGSAFQDVILSELEIERGIKVERMDSFTLYPSIHDETSHLATSLDGRAEDGRIVEAKLHGDWIRDLSEVPHGWLFQVQTQLMVTRAPGAILVVLQRGVDLAVFDILPDPELQTEILLRSREFYLRIQEKNPPPPTVSADNEGVTLLYKYAGDAAKGLVLNNDYLPLLRQRKELLDRKKEVYNDLDLVEANIKFALGSAESAWIEDAETVKVSWKTSKNGVRQLRVYGLSGGE